MLVPYRILAALVCLLVACSSTPSVTPPRNVATAVPAAITLRLVSTRWPPFTDAADQPRVAVDLVSAALERAGYRTTLELVPEGAVLSALQGTTFDGAPAQWPAPGDDQLLLYSDAYLENRLILVGPKGSNVSAQSFGELAGKRIGIVEGHAYGPELEHAQGPVFIKGTSSEENLRALLSGELDYVLEDALVIHHLVRHYPQQTQERLVFGKDALLKRALHLAIRKNRPDAQRIIEQFNRELARMQADGSYNEALHVDWIRADIDGDGRFELVSTKNRVGLAPPTHAYDLVGVTPSGHGGQIPQDPGTHRFLIHGVYYDTWDAVPEEYKRNPSALGAKPGTLRVKVFEF